MTPSLLSHLTLSLRRRMESCYINTAHPDFLSGHQAIAMVNERLHPKPPPNSNEHGKPSSRGHAPHQSPSSSANTANTANQALNSPTSENGSFFGSFFTGSKKPKKSGSALMDSAVFETVSTESGPAHAETDLRLPRFFNSHLLRSRPRVHYRTANIWKLR